MFPENQKFVYGKSRCLYGNNKKASGQNRIFDPVLVFVGPWEVYQMLLHLVPIIRVLINASKSLSKAFFFDFSNHYDFPFFANRDVFFFVLASLGTRNWRRPRKTSFRITGINL